MIAPGNHLPTMDFQRICYFQGGVCRVFALTSTAQQITGHAPVAGTPEVEIVTATENFESRNNFKGEEKLPCGERSER